MAKITTKAGKSIDLKDNENIREVTEKLGVRFSCQNGLCGTCMVDVVKGKENLSSVNDKEKMMGLKESGEIRLACQCKIKSGNVKIDF